MTQTIYWYDLETFGLNPQLDRIAQFAGVRTNDRFEVIGEPLVIYNKITTDYVPDPKACLITGITPEDTRSKGVSEYEFAKMIQKEFLVPGTCVTGYNNLNFDDEFIRNLFYRNFMDPYEREWANGSSRWDIINLLRAAHDLRPEGITWVTKENGNPSFRLEELTAANNISHAHAHDALSDVYATIDMARLIHDKQPRLFSYVFNHRSKTAVRSLIDIHTKNPVLYTSAVFTSPKGCTSIIAPLATDPGNSNLVYCVDLRQDPKDLLTLSSDEIRRRIFTPEGTIPLVKLHVNKCPVLSPLSTLDEGTAERLGLDREASLRRISMLKGEPLLTQKILKVFHQEENHRPAETDPELQIYSGGFFSDKDRKTFAALHAAPPAELFSRTFTFQDQRIPEMFWRFRCRNFPEQMDEETKKQWKSFCAGRILFPPGKMINDFDFFKRKIRENMLNRDLGSREKVLLKKLEDYADFLQREVLSFDENSNEKNDEKSSAPPPISL